MIFGCKNGGKSRIFNPMIFRQLKNGPISSKTFSTENLSVFN